MVPHRERAGRGQVSPGTLFPNGRRKRECLRQDGQRPSDVVLFFASARRQAATRLTADVADVADKGPVGPIQIAATFGKIRAIRAIRG